MALVYQHGKEINHFLLEERRHSFSSACLHCHDAPCYQYQTDEAGCTSVGSLPSDKNREVCPTAAISIHASTGAPQIAADMCVYCGVCVARCPVGAISILAGKGAIVNDTADSNYYETTKYTEASMRKSRDFLASAFKFGAMLDESDVLVDDLQRRIAKACEVVGENFPNHLTRNLLRALGSDADMRRVGGNFLRADIVLGPTLIPQGLVEVEFGDESILNAPRDMLDDIAVFVARHKWKKENIVAFIVGDVLPNRRSEYWAIIKDIQQVLGVRIGTVTVFALMMMVWARKKLPHEISTIAYSDMDSGSYRVEVLPKLVGREMKLTPERSPLVEVIK